MIVNKEATSAINASVKDRNMAGVSKIEDMYEYASIIDSVWSRNWRKNTALAVKSDIVLNLVETVV